MITSGSSAGISRTGFRFRPDVLLFVITPLMFAGNMLVARCIAGDVPPATLAFLRWGIAALVLLPFARGIRSHLGRIFSPDFALLVLTGGVLAVAPLYAAASRTTAGNIALLISAAPAFVMIVERVLFRVELRWPALLGIVMAASGVVTVVTHGHPAALLALSFNAGDALAFAAMLSWVAYTLLSKRRPVKLPPVIGLTALAIGGALMLLPAATVELLHHVREPNFGLVLTWRSLAAILFLCLVPSIGAYGSYQHLVRTFGAARAATSMYIVPIYAVLLAALLLGEALHPYHAAGLMLILGGVALAACAGRRFVAAGMTGEVAAASARPAVSAL